MIVIANLLKKTYKQDEILNNFEFPHLQNNLNQIFVIFLFLKEIFDSMLFNSIEINNCC